MRLSSNFTAQVDRADPRIYAHVFEQDDQAAADRAAAAIYGT